MVRLSSSSKAIASNQSKGVDGDLHQLDPENSESVENPEHMCYTSFRSATGWLHVGTVRRARGAQLQHLQRMLVHRVTIPNVAEAPLPA